MAYNFSVNQNATISKQVCQGANRIYYLKAGKYTAQLKSSDLKVTQTLELFTN
jgi:hypothetical protein